MKACTVSSDRIRNSVAPSIASSSSKADAVKAVNCPLPSLPPASARLILFTATEA